MASGQLESVLQHLRKLVAAEGVAGLSDGALLERFVQRRDEAAFAALVERHGPMVLSVCRRVLRNVHDAEDACQAAFLVLARKAASIRRRGSLASWLHGVAFRAASNLRRKVARRQFHESAAAEPAVAEPAEPSWREVRAVLDEELQRLPARLQSPLLLCYLEGKTRDEAAQQLGWSVSTLRGRLERGRELLRARLTRRGLTLSSALLASLLMQHATEAALPATLLVSSVRAALIFSAGATPAAEVISTRVLMLTEGVIRAMYLRKVFFVGAAVVLLSGVGLGVGSWNRGLFTVPHAEAAPAEPTTVANDAKPEAKDSSQLARHQAESRLNLKQLALAMEAYHNTHGHFPAPAIYEREGPPEVAGGPGGMIPGAGGPGAARGKIPGAGLNLPGMPPPEVPTWRRFGGNALLSWRVALLPFLGEDGLYKLFKLNEPWDSPQNKKLLARMPRVFVPPGVKTREAYTTFYQVFVGPHAAFEKHRGIPAAGFADGTSNTVLIAEAAHAVPWTKPEDIPFAADEPLPELGGLFPEVYNVSMADGSVHAFRKAQRGAALRHAITRDGGELTDFNALQAPTSREQQQLLEENTKLEQSIRDIKQQVDALTRERDVLKEMTENAHTQRLRQHNVELLEQVRQLKSGLAELKKDIERMKQARDEDSQQPDRK